MMGNTKLHQSNVNQQYAVVIDIGAYKIKVCCVLFVGNDFVQVIGCGEKETKGLSLDGSLSSLNLLQEAMSVAYSCATKGVSNTYHIKKLDTKNPRVLISVPGIKIKSKNNFGTCDVNHVEINDRHLQLARDNAKSYSIENYDVIYSEDCTYEVDENKHVEDPRGMVGGQLKVNTHLVYVESNFKANISKVVDSLIDTTYEHEFYFSGTASSYYSITEEDKKLGVCVFDIGASSVDISIYADDRILFTGSSTMAGNALTKELSILLGVPMDHAEEIKCRYGYAHRSRIRPEYIGKDIVISKNSNSENRVGFIELQEMIASKYKDIFAQAFKKMNDINLDGFQLGAGIVLTGGGTLIPGVDVLLSEFINNDKIMVRTNSFESEKIRGMNVDKNPCEFSAVFGLSRLGSLIEPELKDNKEKNNVFFKIKSFFNFLSK